MAIAVFRSLEGESLEDVANALFQKWRLGQKGLDNGVLLVVFVQDRKLRLEVGYGLEAVLPDAEAGRIIREAISPRFREQRYAAGLEAAVGAVYARIVSSSARSPAPPQREVTARLYLVFLALAALTIGGLAWEASHQRGYTAGRRGWGSSGPGGWYGGGWGGGGGGGGFGGGVSGGGGGAGGGGAGGGGGGPGRPRGGRGGRGGRGFGRARP